MAEPWAIAFGRYLRTLRERRGLSLQDVASLSQSFSETLNKGYLSRCENGKQRLGFSKVIPLGRIYKVPADVLVERQELDLELEHVGGAETEGLSFAELTATGAEHLSAGKRLHAYGFFRDALIRATTDPVKTSFRDVNEQLGCACQNAATGARSLGRYRFALHEFLYVKDANLLGPHHYPILLERLSTVYSNLGDIEQSRRYSDDAVAAAEISESAPNRGSVLCTRAHIAYIDNDLQLALALYNKAYEAFRDGDCPYSCALVMNNLSQLHFDQGRLGAARRAASAAGNFAKQNGHFRILALSLILRGEIDEKEGRPLGAEKCWREAASIGKTLNDPVLRFKADFLLLKKSIRDGNEATARSIRRRLKKLSNYIPRDTAELREFCDLETDENVAS